MTVFPVTAASLRPPKAAPTLQYRIYLFRSGKVSVRAISGHGCAHAANGSGELPGPAGKLPPDDLKATRNIAAYAARYMNRQR